MCTIRQKQRPLFSTNYHISASSASFNRHTKMSASSSASSPSSSRGRMSLPLLTLFPLLLVTILGWISPIAAMPLPFDMNAYPTIDIRHLDWPQAQKSTGDDKPYTQLECYTEMDGTFIDSSAIYRVNNSGQLRDRACMLRIPTGIRLTVLKMHVHNRKSYVTVLAGSSQVFTPLSTEHIHEGETDRYGPWHVPCNKAYIVFRSKTSAHHHLEWVEFRLTKETEEDRTQADSEQCTSEGVNHAQVEYGTTNEEEEEATDAAPEEGHQRNHGHHEEADRNGSQETETANDHTNKHSRLRRSFRIARF